MKNRTAFLGVFSALAIILGYVESMIPFFSGIPGMKLGLANMAVIAVLYLYGPADALFVSLVRILVVGMMFGNMVSILYSLTGAVLSLSVMIWLKGKGWFSIRGVSIAGGVFHNIGQLFIAAVTVNTFQIFYYMPLLILSGTLTGILIGILGGRDYAENERNPFDMIAFLRGEIAMIEEDRVIIDVGGIGYEVFMPLSSLKRIGQTGGEIMAYTHLAIREDAAVLYGFLSRDELTMFRLLIGVSGIGPKGALGILSGMSASDLRFAILSDDVKSISAAPGIGKKTAQKLILELKDKIDFSGALDTGELGTAEASGGDDARSDAVQALIALGYSGTDALKAVNRIQGAEGLSTEDIEEGTEGI